MPHYICDPARVADYKLQTCEQEPLHVPDTAAAYAARPFTILPKYNGKAQFPLYANFRWVFKPKPQ